MGSYANLSLGASGNVTYSGASTPSGTTYNLGGGGGTLTFAPAITGAVGLNVKGPGPSSSPAATLTPARPESRPAACGLPPPPSRRGPLPFTASTARWVALASGGTIADTSGNGNNMTMCNGGANLVPGRRGQALQLNGGEFPYTGNLNPGGLPITSWTDSIWVNLPASSLVQGSTDCVLSGRYNSQTSWGFDTWIQDGTSVHVELPGLDGSGNFSSWLTGQPGNSFTFNPNTWYMVTQTVTNNQYQLFVNGQLIGSIPFSGTPYLMDNSATGLTLGAAGTGNNFVGLMDDFSLYTSVLTPAQIQSLYAANVPDGYARLPTGTPLQIAAGGALDLGGISQSVGGLSDYGVGGGSVTDSGAVPATLTVAPPATLTFSGAIEDGASQTALTVAGPGTQVLTGSNTFSGVTTILAGTLQIGNGSNTGSIDSTSAVINNGTLAFKRSDNIVFNPPISGTGGLVQMGSGALAIGSPATYTGPTVVKSGTLQSAAPGATVGLVIGYSFNGSGSIGQYQPFTDLSGNGYTLYSYQGGSSYVPGNGHFANGVSMQGNLLYTGPGSDDGPTTAALPVLTTWTDNIWFNAPASAVNNPGTWTPLFGTTWKTGNNAGTLL